MYAGPVGGGALETCDAHRLMAYGPGGPFAAYTAGCTPAENAGGAGGLSPAVASGAGDDVGDTVLPSTGLAMTGCFSGTAAPVCARIWNPCRIKRAAPFSRNGFWSEPGRSIPLQRTASCCSGFGGCSW